MQGRSETYMPVVARNEARRVVACGTLVIEHKFIHACGQLAHIEDIVVCSSVRSQGLGRLLIQQLKHLAFKHGSYKITLDCDVENEPFYGKSDFACKGLQMCIYYRDDPAFTPSSPKYAHCKSLSQSNGQQRSLLSTGNRLLGGDAGDCKAACGGSHHSLPGSSTCSDL